MPQQSRAWFPFDREQHVSSIWQGATDSSAPRFAGVIRRCHLRLSIFRRQWTKHARSRSRLATLISWIIDKANVKRVNQIVEDAISAGAKVIVRGGQ
jgi:hypothetical protein